MMRHEENYLTLNCGSPFLELGKELQFLAFPHLISCIWSHLYYKTERIANLTSKCEYIIVKSPQACDYKIQYFLISKCYEGTEGESGKLAKVMYWLQMKTDTSWLLFPREEDGAVCVICRYKSC